EHRGALARVFAGDRRCERLQKNAGRGMRSRSVRPSRSRTSRAIGEAGRSPCATLARGVAHAGARSEVVVSELDLSRWTVTDGGAAEYYLRQLRVFIRATRRGSPYQEEAMYIPKTVSLAGWLLSLAACTQPIETEVDALEQDLTTVTNIDFSNSALGALGSP